MRISSAARVSCRAPGSSSASGFNRFSYYGKPGARFENITAFFGPTRIWQYDNFALR